MPDPDDPHDFEDEIDRALERVVGSDEEEPEVTDTTDQRKIRHHIKDSYGDRSNSTLSKETGRLITLAQATEKPLIDLTHEDISDVLFELQRERGWSRSSTTRNYEKALKAFFRSNNRGDFADEIELSENDTRQLEREDIYTNQQIDDMINEADGLRETAIIALLADAGLRIGALCALRRKHYDYTEGPDGAAELTIPDVDGMKGAEGQTIIVTWSNGYVETWLRDHPTPDNPDAALFCRTDNKEHEGEGLSPQYVLRRIKDIGEEAGIDRDFITNHKFRHYSITRWYETGYTKREIEQRAGWSKNSNQHAVYEHLLEDDINTSILEKEGYNVRDNDEDVFNECPRCNYQKVRAGANYCPECQQSLTDTNPIPDEPTRVETLAGLLAGKANERVDDVYDALVSETPMDSDVLYRIVETGHLSEDDKRTINSIHQDGYIDDDVAQYLLGDDYGRDWTNEEDESSGGPPDWYVERQNEDDEEGSAD